MSTTKMVLTGPVAVKATYGELQYPSLTEFTTITEPREIFKDPITDDGTKKSKKGLLSVENTATGLVCHDQQEWFEEESGMLRTVFKDGKLVKEVTLDEIRTRISNGRN